MALVVLGYEGCYLEYLAIKLPYSHQARNDWLFRELFETDSFFTLGFIFFEIGEDTCV